MLLTRLVELALVSRLRSSNVRLDPLQLGPPAVRHARHALSQRLVFALRLRTRFLHQSLLVFVSTHAIRVLGDDGEMSILKPFQRALSELRSREAFVQESLLARNHLAEACVLRQIGRAHV